jgi:gamma-glutamyltranspeptidase/glutathione hydrolase
LRRLLGALALSLSPVITAPAAHAASVPAVEAAHGMVVSSQRLASQAGVDILKAGGNAIDAAVATAYAEAVTNPCCGNIGGGGFMVIHLAATGSAAARDTFIDFREKAPAAATRDMYLDAQGNVIRGASLYGWKAVAVPGSVLGLDTALARYGRLPRAQVMAPSIALAREGFVLTRGDTDILDAGARHFAQNPIEARIFLRPDGTPMQPGDRLVQTDLANTLEAIAKAGPDAFYKGALPQAVEAASRAGGGLLTAADFAAYTVAETPPVRCDYRGYAVISAPPPSSGGTTMCEIFGILEGYDMRALGFHSARSVHLMTEAMRRAYADRNSYLGDPAFVHNPVEQMLSAGYEAHLRGLIGAAATPSAAVAGGLAPPEKTETTHLSVVDQAGNAVSLTTTINGFFGAHAMAPGTGVLMNDEMDDFTSKPGEPNLFGLVQGEANAIAPGKRPLSSMAPTLITQDGRIFLVLGSPGGSRIITITLETALNVIDYAMQPQEAVDAPRLHHQWLPDKLYAEPYALSPDTAALLKGMGYDISEQTPWGAAELIEVGPPEAAVGGAPSSGNDASRTKGVRPGLLYGANDSRRPAGAAVGY